ncbi:hypothetical protein TVNIR_3030 [Thioalkalivibrio nitratireducens DSM 14787]|uniref:Uncharacterized protein n=1 Tax=Thioalkalivibrio nitratireducens (strain DSM 14787 / UNIQEM 213 / ALEN2) TaxID=1255043 RepID=L0E093_THIND|nr:hypothetical protein TVNIR_3030 [Thioalkalivibrio nitratireducens DSM 14787]
MVTLARTTRTVNATAHGRPDALQGLVARTRSSEHERLELDPLADVEWV